MIKLAKVINQETKSCAVGTGTNTAKYRAMGFVEMDVEQAYNGVWYVKGFAPAKPEPTKEEQLAAYKAELADLDSQAVRPLRAVAAGTASDFDREKLAQLETRAEELRQKIKELAVN